MEPTFHDGDVVLTTALNSKLQKDDIVILKDPFRPDQKICKRVLGEILLFQAVVVALVVGAADSYPGDTGSIPLVGLKKKDHAKLLDIFVKH